MSVDYDEPSHESHVTRDETRELAREPGRSEWGCTLPKRIVLMVLMAVLLPLLGCAAKPVPKPTTEPRRAPAPSREASEVPRLEADGNFVLWVSNQSFDLDPVDIAVEIDGTTVIDRSFDVGNQHNWKKFVLRLRPGGHTIHARSSKGDVTMTRKFAVDQKQWAVIDFWYNDGTSGTPTDPLFTFTIDDQPIGFM